MYAWHFMAGYDEPILRDGRPCVVGEWLRHDGPVDMRSSGLHASWNARDALGYAPGSWVALCEIDDIVAEGSDKLVCRARRPLWAFDATEELRHYARLCALKVAHLWTPLQIVLEYLRTGDENIRAAAGAAALAAARAAQNDLLESILLGVGEAL